MTSVKEFRKTLDDLKDGINRMIKFNKNISKEFIEECLRGYASTFNYEKSQASFNIRGFLNNLKKARNELKNIKNLSEIDSDNTVYINKILKIIDETQNIFLDGFIEKVPEKLAEIIDTSENLKAVEMVELGFDIPSLPSEIESEIKEDVKELEKTFNTGCYRSAVILCGRILETALHRKYYEATGVDALEKTPGIGLGNLIAKLREKGIGLDPAITQQIHLINQVRIFSVHIKKQIFNPTKSQTQAVILYTLDILKKLFE